jgi:hypothetical protein
MRIGENGQLTSPQDMGSSFNLSPILLDHVANFSIQLAFSGSPNGRFKLQASNDSGRNKFTQEKDLNSIVNWSDITGTSSSINGSGTLMWSLADIGYKWVRVVYTRTSGTGSLNSCNFFTKGI